MEMSVESELTTLEPYTGALMTFGIVSFVQYIVYLRGDLHSWIQTDRLQLDDDFNLGNPLQVSPRLEFIIDCWDILLLSYFRHKRCMISYL